MQHSEVYVVLCLNPKVFVSKGSPPMSMLGGGSLSLGGPFRPLTPVGQNGLQNFKLSVKGLPVLQNLQIKAFRISSKYLPVISVGNFANSQSGS